MRAFSALCLVSLQVGVLLSAQPSWGLPLPVLVPQQPTAPAPPSAEVTPSSANNEILPQFSRYFLGPGDLINIAAQRPVGPYHLEIGDMINVFVQRFPDLSFQAQINPEGNIVVPLLGNLQLQGLTLADAQAKIRSSLNRYVINPVIVLSLTGQRPDLNFQAAISPEGNIAIPQVGTVYLQGLSLEEAQEKVRMALSHLIVDPVVTVSLAGTRPVQVTIIGQVFRPGIYTANSALPRIADTLQLAGGSTLAADLRQVQVRRKLVDGSVISQNINLYAAIQNGNSVPNLRLQDGDTIVVPHREVGADDGYDRNLIAHSTLAVSQIKVRVLNYTGGGIMIQTLPNGSTFTDALGGINPDTANLRDIALVRFDPERGKAITQRLDAKRALAGDASQNVALQDNDVIIVGRNLIGRVTYFLSTITQPFFNVQSFVGFFQNFSNGLFNGNSGN
jgi:polysaccharide export outer membrane protein